jgi:predicted ester cyclase
MVAEGDRVAVWATHRGTHTGQFIGIPQTGSETEVTNLGMFRIADGRRIHLWSLSINGRKGYSCIVSEGG